MKRVQLNVQRRVRKQKQKTIKQEQADTTVRQYRLKCWTTKTFARPELPPKELIKTFRRWGQRIHDACAKEDRDRTLDEFRTDLQAATASSNRVTAALFQTNQEHHFLPLGADRTEYWQWKIPSRAVPDSDPRCKCGWMTYQAYRGNTPTITKEEIFSTYPYSLKEAILEVNAKILAQGLHPDPTATEKSKKERAILERLESSHHDGTPDCLVIMRDARERLLQG
jgi:hypothetical protein